MTTTPDDYRFCTECGHDRSLGLHSHEAVTWRNYARIPIDFVIGCKQAVVYFLTRGRHI